MGDTSPRRLFDWLRAVAASDMSPGARHLCHVLGALHMNPKKAELECWPSQAKLAAEMGVGTARAVRKYVAEARESGFLETEKVGPRRIVYRAVVSAKSLPESDIENLRGDVAPIIRERWWKGKKSPEEGWTMGREYSFLDTQAKRHGWSTVLRAVEIVPEVYRMNGKPFTGRLVASAKTRPQWNRCLELARREALKDDETARPRSFGEIDVLEGIES